MVASFLNFKKSLSSKKFRREPELIKKGGFLNDRANRFFIVMGAVFNLIAWLLVFAKLMSFPEPIILHYNAYFGMDLEGSNKEALFLPAAGLLILILNCFLGVVFRKKDILVSKIVLATAFLFNLIINIALITLISVNKV